MRFRLCYVALVALVLIVPLAFPQQDAGGLLVSVVDPGGATVPGAKVTVRNVSTNAEVSGASNGLGVWTASPLRPGDYQVTVEKEGFRKAVSETVQVGVQQTPRVVVSLTIGSVSESVTVAAEATTLQTVDVSKGQLISGEIKNELPLSDRNYGTLAKLAVGVASVTPSVRDGSGSGAFTANGIRQYQNNYVLDGTDNNLYDQNVNEGRTFAIAPSLDSIAEFKVQTNAFSAEFGRGGGATVNVVTKSGANSLHGSFYEYRQGSDVNANSFFNNAKKIPISPYHFNQYGATIGGPAYLPKVYDGRDKSFFFFDFEKQPRRAPGQLVLGAVPTAAQAAGDFSGGKTIYDPTTGQPFPNNRIPVTDPVAAKIAAAIPKPNTTGTNNYFANVPNKSDDYRVAVRGDQKLTSRDQIFGRFQVSHLNSPAPSLFTSSILSADSTITTDAKGVVVNNTHTFSPSLVNETRFGWMRLDWRQVPSLAGQDINSQVGIKGVPLQGGGITGGLASIQFSSNLSAYGGVNVEEDLSEVFQGSDTATWIHGRHLVKFGWEYRHISFLSTASSFAPEGQFQFDGHYTAGTGSTGEPFADFLLGQPNNARISAVHTNDYQRRAHGLFVQDAFKLSARLTLNFGLRYDYVTPVFEAYNHGSALNVFARVLNIPGYTGTFPDSVQRQIGKGLFSVNTNASKYWNLNVPNKNFGPRFGFAYSLDQKTVVRGGYGLYYGMEELGGWGEPSMGFSTPFLAQASFSPADQRPATRNPVTFGTGFPASALTNPTGTTIYAMDPGLRAPYFQQWNLTVQREIIKNLSTELSYIGSKTTAAFSVLDYNMPSLTTDPSIPFAVRQPFPDVDASGQLVPGSAIQGLTNPGMGKYHGLGFKAEKRVGATSFVSSYTFSHAIDNVTNFGLSVGNNGRAGYPTYEKLQKSNSDNDVRHRWTNGFVFQLPFGKGQRFARTASRWTDLLIGGWQTSGIFTVESGQWFAPSQDVDSGNINGTAYCGNCRQRPDIVPGQNPNAGPRKVDPNDPNVHWFNANAFTKAANGTIGNSGRNIIEGPGLGQIDGSISKTFHVTEKSRFQFRTEFYNMTNSSNFIFGAGSTSPVALRFPRATFGNIQGDRGGRVIQFGLRFDY